MMDNCPAGHVFRAPKIELYVKYFSKARPAYGYLKTPIVGSVFIVRPSGVVEYVRAKRTPVENIG